MKTLTITDAKKNLGTWLKAAIQGEDIAIVCGADIVALRPVRVQAVDYAEHEYGVTKEELAAFDKWSDSHVAALRASGKLRPPTGKLKVQLEQAAPHRTRRTKATG